MVKKRSFDKVTAESPVKEECSEEKPQCPGKQFQIDQNTRDFMVFLNDQKRVHLEKKRADLEKIRLAKERILKRHLPKASKLINIASKALQELQQLHVQMMAESKNQDHIFGGAYLQFNTAAGHISYLASHVSDIHALYNAGK